VRLPIGWVQTVVASYVLVCYTRIVTTDHFWHPKCQRTSAGAPMTFSSESRNFSLGSSIEMFTLPPSSTSQGQNSSLYSNLPEFR
jgi:hypothetical protein